ncbi:MAG: hypothetical protein ACKO37_10130 [Vampirovibrionales bacterium]
MRSVTHVMLAVKFSQTLQKTWANLPFPFLSGVFPTSASSHQAQTLPVKMVHEVTPQSTEPLLHAPRSLSTTKTDVSRRFPFEPDTYILPFVPDGLQGLSHGMQAQAGASQQVFQGVVIPPTPPDSTPHSLEIVSSSHVIPQEPFIMNLSYESSDGLMSQPVASDYDALAAKLEALEQVFQDSESSVESTEIEDVRESSSVPSYDTDSETSSMTFDAQLYASSTVTLPDLESPFETASLTSSPSSEDAQTVSSQQENLSETQEPLFASVSSMSSSYSESTPSMNYAAPANPYNDVTIASQGQSVYPTRVYGAEVSPQPVASEPDISSNVQTLLRLIGDLPEGVSKQVGAQIIRSTMEAMGIAMDEVLSEAQNAQTGLLDRVRSNLRKIDEYNTFIRKLQDESKYFQSKAAELGEVIDLFVMSSPSNTSWMNQQDDV